MANALVFDVSPAGQIEGINDAGIETFAGNHLGSLAREQGQNSMDAKDAHATGPVEISYELIYMEPSEIPGSEELQTALDSVEKFWSAPSRHHDKTLNFVRKANKLLASSRVPVLRISDRNTTGLCDSDKELQGDWFALTKASGVSLKGEGKLGSFGIGKNVFWGNSRLRTVYFSTHDINGLWAFQGVTKLASHSDGGKAIKRAVGFYGKDGFIPIRQKTAIPSRFRTNGVGTDIFVAGFDVSPDWTQELIAAFAENFFVAFEQDLLHVRIGEHELSSANIRMVIEGLALRESKRFSDVQNFYDALTSEDAKEFTTTFENLGKVTLRLLLREGARKRVAMFRGTGMKIFEKAHFRTPLEFAGIFICDDTNWNEFLRQLEPPSHNAWEPERDVDDPQRAKQVIQRLYNWMHECVRELNSAQGQVSLEVPELERYLPDVEDTEPFEGDTSHTEGDPHVQKEILLVGRTKRDRPPVKSEQDDAEDVGDLDDGQKGEAGPGPNEGERTGGDPNDSKGGDRGSGSGPTGDGGEEQNVPYRIFKLPGPRPLYIMRTELPAKGKYSFSLFAVGDDGRTEATEPLVPVYKDAKGNAKQLTLSAPNRIGRVDVLRAGILEIEFELKSPVPLTLNAKVFRHG